MGSTVSIIQRQGWSPGLGRYGIRRVSLVDLLLTAAFGIVALLYASVGQAGGTGYVALMGGIGFAPDVIKPTALALNILVASVGCWRFYRAGLLTWRTCYPFAILGAPFSLAGGATTLRAEIYQPIVGALLMIAAVQMWRSARGAAVADQKASEHPPFFPSLLIGGVIGYVSGLTGVGGGIFLAPLVLSLGWVATRQAAGVSAVFNLMNSATALAGTWVTIPALPADLPFWLVAVAVGGFVGSWLGAGPLAPRAMRLLLALLLLAAGLRMILS
jgi:uncharacterized membrane protein YfcA